ncbi:MAG TPA: hypothetical protein VIG06_29180 [Kofleriaceae bacterium]
MQRRGFAALLMTTCAMGSAGCPTVDLGETPVSPGSCRPDPAYYRDVIWPDFVDVADTTKSCVGDAACHRIEDGRSALRFTTNPVDDNRNYDNMTRFLNCGAPEASAALTKPLSGVDPHGGGDLFTPGSDPETTFLEWFATQ